MSSVSDTESLLGNSYFLEQLLVQIPPSYEHFIGNLYREIDNATTFMESDAADFMGQKEEFISRALVRQLKQKSFLATTETDSGGHCDITVTSADQKYSWLGEAKRWGGPQYIHDGFDQLLRRYSKATPGSNHGGLLLYVQIARCADRLQDWRERLTAAADSYEDLILTDDASRPGFAFSSSQVHERTGSSGPRYQVRHMAMSLYRPASDKSGAQCT